MAMVRLAPLAPDQDWKVEFFGVAVNPD